LNAKNAGSRFFGKPQEGIRPATTLPVAVFPFQERWWRAN
jgi:hypothetical protein